jgi:tRNA(Ile)-lysidine synthase
VPFDAERLAGLLTAIDPRWKDAPLCVGLSGGLDSTALLHATAALAAREGLALRALHVNHGLQPQSDDWVDACRRVCAGLGVAFESREVRVARGSGGSLEAEARSARYAAVAAALADGERFLAAHHRDDQLETVLIQLLRGAGVAGLAAMPHRAPLGQGWLLRPLLEVGRDELEDYANRNGLAWLQDPMNGEERFDRAYLRKRVLPPLLERWPAAAATIGRSASHLAEASRLIAVLAEADARALLDEGRLDIRALARLSRDRQVNVLRWWLREQRLRPPPAARLGAALAELLGAKPDGAPCLRWTEGEIRRYRGRLYALAPLPAFVETGREATRIDLGAGLGHFSLVASSDGGLRIPPGVEATLGFRMGGESLRPHPGRPRKRLKALCQEAGVVPWMRDRLPLVYVGGRLAAVADLWIDAEFFADGGADAVKPVWTGRPRLF